MNINLNQDLNYQCVDNILNSQNFDEVKTAASAFIAVTENLEGMFVWMMCHHLTDTLVKWSEPYKTAPRGSKNNVVIVPPEHAPVMLLLSSIPINVSPNEIKDGLKKFVVRCDEFTSPVYKAITTAEMNRVLNATQKAYRILDLLAPKEPQKIFCFNNSHVVYNSMCGIPNSNGRMATILVFNPRETGTYDRIFIFAHELGHALHFALTGDIEVMPDGFDAFNKSILVNIKTLKGQQEAFADAVALAILNAKGLGTHFPTQFSKDMSPCFARYIKTVTEKALAGNTSV